VLKNDNFCYSTLFPFCRLVVEKKRGKTNDGIEGKKRQWKSHKQSIFNQRLWLKNSKRKFSMKTEKVIIEYIK
jgi:hypothetical protein